MCLALVSALTKNPTKSDVAMTGEITLRSRVLGVGGLKAKILAARQHDKKTVLVPEENKNEVEEVLKDIEDTKDLNIVYVNNMDEVLKLALEKNPFKIPVKRKTAKKTTPKEKVANPL